MFTEHDFRNVLINMYTAWNDANGLDLGSADEHLRDPTLTHKQRKWLEIFCIAWDAMERMEQFTMPTKTVD